MSNLVRGSINPRGGDLKRSKDCRLNIELVGLSKQRYSALKVSLTMVIKAQDVFRVCDGCVFMKPHSLKHSSQRVDISCAVPFMANTKDAPLVCKKRSM